MVDIKIGDNYKDLKKKLNHDKSICITALPTFCLSEYKVVTNLDTDEEVYILVDNNMIIDVTTEYSRAVDEEKANQMLKEILDNNRR